MSLWRWVRWCKPRRLKCPSRATATCLGGVGWTATSGNAALCAVQTWVSTLPYPLQGTPDRWIWALEPGEMLSACWLRASWKNETCLQFTNGTWEGFPLNLNLWWGPAMGDYPPLSTDPEMGTSPVVGREVTHCTGRVARAERATHAGVIDLVTGSPLLREVDFELPFGSAVFRHVRTYSQPLDIGKHENQCLNEQMWEHNGGNAHSRRATDLYWDWNGTGWMTGENPILLIDSRYWAFNENADQRRCYLISDGPAVGLYQNRNRTYAAHLRRFIQRDPNGTGQPLLASNRGGQGVQPVSDAPCVAIASSDGLNLHCYQQAQPNGSTDPTGLLTEEGTNLALAVLQSMIEAYSTNLEWDVDWATNWSTRDDEHTRLHNKWVLLAIGEGATRWMEDQEDEGGFGAMLLGGSGRPGRARPPGFSPTRLKYRPPGSGVPDLPAFSPRSGTQGVLRTSKFEVSLTSGEGVHSRAKGAGQVIRTHVEAKAVSIMRQTKSTTATLYLNRAPCVDARGVGCGGSFLPTNLGRGERLHVYVNGVPYRSYLGK